ncbi:MAG: right-handed parallel beta-helix repeat-containing protein [Planctomycetota bacterium]
MRLQIALLALGLGVGVAGAKDIYVSRNGKNSNDGTKEAPLKSLWKAMGMLEPGDAIHVSEGEYPGRGKSGVMPPCEVTNVTIEGGWKDDWSERDPFKYLSIISPPGDTQGAGTEVFQFMRSDNKLGNITLDGFCIDRGPHNYYSSEGEVGANKQIEGHVDTSAWGYRAMNRKKSGSDPTIEIIARDGNVTVRNMILVNNPWWGISVKGGGDGEIRIENNLILISQGRGIEAITGGGWGNPKWVIRNNTVMFNHTLASTEGRALSADPRKGYGTYLVENNVFAYSDGGGITVKFGAEMLTLKNNLFYFNRRGDMCEGGSPLCNAPDFEDELECDNEGNVRELPKATAKVDQAWFDRWSIGGPDRMAGELNTWEELKAAREAVGLTAEFKLIGYDEAYPDYKSLPDGRPNYGMSRYPHPMKKGELIDWQSVLGIVGADEGRGIQPYSAE